MSCNRSGLNNGRLRGVLNDLPHDRVSAPTYTPMRGANATAPALHEGGVCVRRKRSPRQRHTSCRMERCAAGGRSSEDSRLTNLSPCW